MYHLAAYSSSNAQNVEVDTTPVPDGILLTQNGHFVSQVDRYLIWAMGIGLTLNRARIITPSLRQVTTPFIRPIEEAAAPGNLAHFMDLRYSPILLKGLEEIQVNTFQSSAGAERENVLIALADGPPMMSSGGQVWCMRGTGTTAAVANTWTAEPIVWQDTLPVGTYQCIGLEVLGAAAIAGRLTFENQYLRPGCPATSDFSKWCGKLFTEGVYGVWGKFTSVRMPTLEVLATAATAAWEVYLYFQRTS